MSSPEYPTGMRSFVMMETSSGKRELMLKLNSTMMSPVIKWKLRETDPFCPSCSANCYTTARHLITADYIITVILTEPSVHFWSHTTDGSRGRGDVTGFVLLRHGNLQSGNTIRFKLNINRSFPSSSQPHRVNWGPCPAQVPAHTPVLELLAAIRSYLLLSANHHLTSCLVSAS